MRVLDANGQFVPSLTQSDFRILEDGKPQTIARLPPSTSLCSCRFNGAGCAGLRLEPVATNDPVEVDGRAYLFVLDNQSMTAAVSLRTRHVVRGFIRDALKANDLAAIVMTGTGRGQPFTRSRRLLNEAIDRLLSDADPTDNIGEAAAHRTLNFIADTADRMGPIKGRRKALVLVSPSPICGLFRIGPSGEELSTCLEGARHALRRAMMADVSIYTIDPRGAVPTSGAPAEVADPGVSARWPVIVRGPFDAARYLAEESGGFAVVNSNSLSAGFARIAREHSSYYLVGYYSTNNEADGKFRRNVVTVSRRGLRVVHRGGYIAASANARPLARTRAGRSTAENPTIEDQLQELSDSPVGVSSMALRVAAAPFRAADGSANVVVVVEMPAETLKFVEEDGRRRLNIRASVGFYNRDGESVGDADPNVELDLPIQTGWTAQGVRAVSRIPVPSGAYLLWAGAVQTPSGVRGSVLTDVAIPDFRRRSLTLSGVAVSDDAADRMHTAYRDDLLEQMLGAPPVVPRQFDTDTVLTLYVEIYDNRTKSGPVIADATVKSRDGTVVHRAPFETTSHPFGRLARIPLKNFVQGSYIATVEAMSLSPKRVSVARNVAFSVR